MTDDEYRGLHGEVATEDIYRLKELTFAPDLIVDIGANVGVFARFAWELWPDAKIVCVEPNPGNFTELDACCPPGDVVLMNAAIGSGKMWRSRGAVNGPGETYLSVGLGYDTESFDDSYEPVEVDTISLADLFALYWKPGRKSLVKMDCEGGENAIIRDPASVAALQRADYITAELHFHAAHGGKLAEVRNETFAWMADLMATHRLEYIHPMLYATRKEDDSQNTV